MDKNLSRYLKRTDLAARRTSCSLQLLILAFCLMLVSVQDTTWALDEDSLKQLPQSGLAQDLLEEIMEFLPEALHESTIELNEMLKAEARSAFNTKRGGRRPNSFHFVQTFMGSTAYGKHLSYPSFMQTKTLGIIKHELDSSITSKNGTNATKGRFSLTNAEANQLMAIMPKILRDNTYTMLPHMDLPRPNPLQCPYPIDVVCEHQAKYRTYDGRCNNLRYPLWGAAHQPLARFVPPLYADAISAPRVAINGRSLPSPRLVSAVVHWDFDLPHHFHNLMLMQFGQFLDHDLSRTAITKLTVSENGMSAKMEDVSCGEDGCETGGLENQACFPIEVPRNDTDFSKYRRCLMFVRSQEVPNSYCKPGPREQLNQLTSYIDASLIYGSTVKEAMGLRDIKPDRGRLKTSSHPAGRYKDLLPLDEEGTIKECRGDNRTILCFKAGDGRVNEFSGITTQHVVWVREHNRVEEALHRMNPYWDGERLFQETRRIIIALWQYTTFAEYLPIILGRHVMDSLGLTLANHGHWNGYDETVNANVANSFATAAMRFGHTQLQGLMSGRDYNYRVLTNIPLSTQLRRPHLIYEAPQQGIDMMMLGLIGDSTQQRDQFITKQVTRHLFSENPPNAVGEDLMSLNMQRGRDHGLPGYNYFREWCGLKRVNHFDELINDLPIDVVNRFKVLYGHVDDIDLWPAGISEKSSAGAFLGPTFTCILSRQFRNAKFGDRFWFEEGIRNPYPFTPAQLTEIRKFRYSKLLCNNADRVETIQPHAFLHPYSVALEVARLQNQQLDLTGIDYIYSSLSGNERVPCASIPDYSLEPWRDNSIPPPPPPPPPPPSHKPRRRRRKRRNHGHG